MNAPSATTEPDAEWARLLQRLPGNLAELIMQAGGLRRKRRVRDAQTLLRLVLSYSFAGMSLQAVVTWARQKGVADLTDGALLKRLRKAPDWLGPLVAQVLRRRNALPEGRSSRRIIVVDATTINEEGVHGTAWRVHLAWELAGLQLLCVVPTTGKEGESLAHFRFEPGDIVVCDRGYSHRAGIWSLLQQQGDVLVRINWQNLPLLSVQGEPLDILAFLRGIGEQEVGQVCVQIAPDPKKKIAAMPGRLVALRKSAQAAERARRKAYADAKKKGHTPDARTLEACEYMFAFTSVPAEHLDAAEVLRLYRFRWQIELAIKRMKSLMHLDSMRAHDPQVCRAFLLGKLLVSLLIEDVVNGFLAGPPGDTHSPPAPSVWRLVQALADTIRTAIVPPVRLAHWSRSSAEKVCELYADPYDKRSSQTMAARSLSHVPLPSG